MPDYLLTLNLQQFADEKTEKATPKKRQESRKKGQVARSNEINTALVLLFVFLILKIFGPYMGRGIFNIFQKGLSEYILWEVNQNNLQVMIIDVFFSMFMIVLPVMLTALIAGVVANLIQVGFMFTTDPLKIELSKISPLKGLKRMFSLKSIVNLVKSVLKIVVISAVAYISLWYERETIFHLNRLEVFEIVSFVTYISVEIGWRVAILLLLLSIPDYAYEKFSHEKQIRMSKKDIKDEHKRSEGDPAIKGKRREIQRRMAMQRMMSDVPKADVVITNPTHFSVAVQYEAADMSAPLITAKGTDLIALKIRKIAEEHDIPIVENKPLAQTLYKTLEVGDSVPEELFQAVAEILAYVYKLKGKAG